MIRTFKQRSFKCRHIDSGLHVMIYEFVKTQQVNQMWAPPVNQVVSIRYETESGDDAAPTTSDAKSFNVYAELLCNVTVVDVTNLNEQVA